MGLGGGGGDVYTVGGGGLGHGRLEKYYGCIFLTKTPSQRGVVGLTALGVGKQRERTPKGVHPWLFYEMENSDIIMMIDYYHNMFHTTFYIRIIDLSLYSFIK